MPAFAELRMFLLDAFDTAELLRLARGLLGASGVHSLPSPKSDHAEVVDAVIGILHRHGVDGAILMDKLEYERPHRLNEIVTLARSKGLDWHPRPQDWELGQASFNRRRLTYERMVAMLDLGYLGWPMAIRVDKWGPGGPPQGDQLTCDVIPLLTIVLRNAAEAVLSDETRPAVVESISELGKAAIAFRDSKHGDKKRHAGSDEQALRRIRGSARVLTLSLNAIHYYPLPPLEKAAFLLGSALGAWDLATTLGEEPKPRSITTVRRCLKAIIGTDDAVDLALGERESVDWESQKPEAAAGALFQWVKQELIDRTIPATE